MYNIINKAHVYDLPKRPSQRCPVSKSNPDPNNTIGLFQFLTRNKTLSSENESNCSMTSECVRSDSILPRGAGLEHDRRKQSSSSDGSCWEIVIIKQIHTFTSNIIVLATTFRSGLPHAAFIMPFDLIKAGAPQTETSLLKQLCCRWTCGFAWW